MPKAAPPNTPFSTPLSGSAREAEDRIRNIFQYQKKRPPALLLALSCALNLPLVRRRHYFCSQFVAGLLEDSGAARLPKPPALLRPADFQGVRGLRPVHRGLLAGLLAQPAA